VPPRIASIICHRGTLSAYSGRGVATVVCLLWAIVIWCYGIKTARIRFFGRLAALLLAGSLIATVIGIASLVTPSNRQGGIFNLLLSLMTIAAAIYVALFALGMCLAAIFLRAGVRDQATHAGRCPACDYDLRGTIAAKRRTCPECGEVIATVT